MRLSRVVLVLGMVATPLLAASCGSSGPSGKATASNSDQSQGTTRGLTFPSYLYAWTIKTVDSSGASWTTTLSIGSPIEGGNIAHFTVSSLASECSTNFNSDAVIPFLIKTTSTTAGSFTASGDQTFAIVNSALQSTPVGELAAITSQGTESDAGFNAGEALYGIEALASGTSCTQLDPNTGDANNPGDESNVINFGSDNLASGSSQTIDGVFDLENFFTPSEGSGDQNWLSNIWILVPYVNAIGTDNTFQNYSVTGPHLVPLLGFTPTSSFDSNHDIGSSNSGYGWAFPIDGTSTPDCADAASSSPITAEDSPSIQTLCNQAS